MSDQRPGTVMSALMLAVFLAIVFGVAALGAMATQVSVETWYPRLAKPALTPPPWVFPVVWTGIYALMGFSVWLVWRNAGGILKAPLAFLFFFVQLGLNLLWSVLFFGGCNPQGALLEIVVLWALILATVIAFMRHSRTASWLLVPYLLWVAFAAWLNLGIVRLNPDLTGGCI